MDVWKDVFLKKIDSCKLKDSNTLAEIQGNKKIQVFEFLVAETLAQIYPQMEWKVSQVQSDGGVDIYGKIKCPLSPIQEKESSLLILGQVKRRGGTYKFEDYKNDITKMYEYYISNALFVNHSLIKLIFVISTNKAKQIENLTDNLNKVIKKKQPSLFTAHLYSPIEMINASDIINYWKLNPDFILNKLDETLTEEQKNTLIVFLRQLDGNFIQISYTENEQPFIFNTFTKKVFIENQLPGVPLEIYIRWCPNGDKEKNIQLLTPLPLTHDTGMKMCIRNNSTLSLNFRGLNAGTYSLGNLYIETSSKKLLRVFDLGTVSFNSNFYYRYNSLPYTCIELGLKKSIKDFKEQIAVYAILGHGGIGKSSFLEQLQFFAENNSYVCVALSYPKDRINNRNFVINLIYKLLKSDTILLKSTLVDKLRGYLNIYYQERWTEGLTAFFNDEKVLTLHSVSECLQMLIWYNALTHPVFIWLKDMHWINKENKELFNEFLSQLIIGKSYLANPVRIFLEGRDKEYIRIDDKNFFPYDWHCLIDSDYIFSYTLKPWTRDDSKNYIYSLFDKKELSTKLFEKSCGKLIKYVQGFPMLILEQLQYLMDIGKIILTDENKFIVLDYNWSSCFSGKIQKAINQRIAYYSEKYSDICDCLTIWSHICEISPEGLWKALCIKLKEKYNDLNDILHQSHFLKQELGKTIFFHEYYKDCFKNISINNSDYVQYCVQWINKQEHISLWENFLLILLYQLDNNVSMNFLSTQVQKLLMKCDNDFINYQLFKILLDLPESCLPSNLPKYFINYQLGECIIRIGNWYEGIEYFKDCLNYINYDDQKSLLFYAEACQELGNLCCDLLLFTEAFEYCNKGISLLETLFEQEVSLKNSKKFYQAYNNLVERLAVCYWFSGELELARTLQIKAYKNSCALQDTYMELRCLYEIGTLNFHFDLDKGIEQIEKALSMREYIPPEFKQEELLIQVQLLIGKLVKSAQEFKENPQKISNIKKIFQSSDFLCAKMKKNIFVYESCLCYLVRGISLYFLQRYEDALNSFILSIERAESSGSKNMLWKGYINASQICVLMGNLKQGQYYARKCLTVFEEYCAYNPIPNLSFEHAVYIPIKIIQKILGEKVECFSHNTSYAESSYKMIEIQSDNCIFYLMN